MPLAKTKLKDDLEALFSNPPFNEASDAERWGDAMGEYAAAVAPPCGTVPAAAAALTAALAGFGVPGAGVAKLEAAFAAFAVSVAAGMPPPATPPPPPVGFANLMSGQIGSASVAAQQLADLIDTWMRTGTAAGGALWS